MRNNWIWMAQIHITQRIQSLWQQGGILKSFLSPTNICPFCMLKRGNMCIGCTFCGALACRITIWVMRISCPTDVTFLSIWRCSFWASGIWYHTRNCTVASCEFTSSTAKVELPTSRKWNGSFMGPCLPEHAEFWHLRISSRYWWANRYMQYRLTLTWSAFKVCWFQGVLHSFDWTELCLQSDFITSYTCHQFACASNYFKSSCLVEKKTSSCKLQVDLSQSMFEAVSRGPSDSKLRSWTRYVLLEMRCGCSKGFAYMNYIQVSWWVLMLGS